MNTFTSGDWYVTAGSETEFEKIWSDFAHWSAKNIKGAGEFYLIKDTNNPSHYVSFGSWESPKDVSDQRANAEFKRKIAACKALCDSMTAGDYQLKVSSK